MLKGVLGRNKDRLCCRQNLSQHFTVYQYGFMCVGISKPLFCVLVSFTNILLKEPEVRVSIDPHNNLCFVPSCNQQLLPSVLLSRSCLNAEMIA